MDVHQVGRVFELIDREIWIITAAHEGRRGGLVATFVTAASIVAGMPRIIAGLAKTHETRKLVEASGAFAAHLVEETQTALVWQFGLQSSRDVDKFAGLDVGAAATGSPILRDAPAWLDCRVESQMDTGDRTVFLGQVCDGRSKSGFQPLRMHKLLELATPTERQTMREQLASDAAIDFEAIRRWRAGR
jgi:flavin reductase (DIM6/NTAB) family NADH-FMN oxidoreductase RutF